MMWYSYAWLGFLAILSIVSFVIGSLRGPGRLLIINLFVAVLPWTWYSYVILARLFNGIPITAEVLLVPLASIWPFASSLTGSTINDIQEDRRREQADAVRTFRHMQEKIASDTERSRRDGRCFSPRWQSGYVPIFARGQNFDNPR